MTTVMGIDAAAGEWLAVILDGGAYAGADLQPAVADLLDRHPEAEVVATDIPIGLPLGRFRPADEGARRFVGPARAASVFSTFPNEVPRAEPHEGAVTLARRPPSDLGRHGCTHGAVYGVNRAECRPARDPLPARPVECGVEAVIRRGTIEP